MLNPFKRHSRGPSAPNAVSGESAGLEERRLAQAAENEVRRQASEMQHRQEAVENEARRQESEDRVRLQAAENERGRQAAQTRERAQTAENAARHQADLDGPG